MRDRFRRRLFRDRHQVHRCRLDFVLRVARGVPQRRQVFLGEGVCFLAGLVQVRAPGVRARHVAQVRRAVLGRAVARTDDAAAWLLAAVDRDDRTSRIFLALVCHIHAHRRIMRAMSVLAGRHALADEDFGHASVLAKVVGALERRDELLARELGAQAHDVHQVLLHDAHVREVLAVGRLHLLLFALLVLLRVRKPHNPASLVACTHSSVDMALNSMAWSEYFRRHAGHRPFKFCLMWCQQNRHIW